MRSIIKFLIFAAIGGAPVPVLAQPSGVCAQASTPFLREICAKPNLAAEWEALETAQAKLRDGLAPAEAAHFDADILRWRRYFETPCGEIGDPFERCVQDRLRNRHAWLAKLQNGPYPYIGFYGLRREGKRGKIAHEVDVRWLAFAAPGGDFDKANAEFAIGYDDDNVEEFIVETTKSMREVDDEREVHFEELAWIDFDRPTPDLVNVWYGRSEYSGQPHALYWDGCYLIDWRTGKIIAKDQAFGPRRGWRDALAKIVHAELVSQFKTNPGYSDKPPSRKKIAASFGKTGPSFCWRADRLDVEYGLESLGPYSSGPYSIAIPYASIEKYLSGGPLRPKR